MKGRAEIWAEVGSWVEALQRKYGEYVSFQFTKYADGHMKYNIYTEAISHNDFATHEELCSFIDSMIKDENGIYRAYRLMKLNERRAQYIADIAEIDEDIERLQEDAA